MQSEALNLYINYCVRTNYPCAVNIAFLVTNNLEIFFKRHSVNKIHILLQLQTIEPAVIGALRTVSDKIDKWIKETAVCSPAILLQICFLGTGNISR